MSPQAFQKFYVHGNVFNAHCDQNFVGLLYLKENIMIVGWSFYSALCINFHFEIYYGLFLKLELVYYHLL